MEMKTQQSGSLCDICQIIFPLRSSMLKHRQVHFLKVGGVKKAERYQSAGTCDICDKYFTTSTNMQRHRKTHFAATRVDLKERTCTICSQVYAEKYYLRKHMEAVHPGRKMLGAYKNEETVKSCRIGAEKVKSIPDSLVEDKSKSQHIISDEERAKIDQMMRSKGNTKCLICNKKVILLKRHVKIVHLKILPHKCKSCGFASFNKSDLKKHLQRKQSCIVKRPVQHQKLTSKDTYSRVRKSMSTRRLPSESEKTSRTCPVCAKLFSHRCTMTRHKRLVHTLQPEKQVKNIQAEAKSAQMQEHVLLQSSLANSQGNDKYLNGPKMENGPQTQDIIDVGEQKKIEKMMQSEADSKCLICHKKLRASWYLKRHVQAVHMNLRPYQCQFCSFAFNQKVNLHTHVKRMHCSKDTVQAAQYQKCESKNEQKGASSCQSELTHSSVNRDGPQCQRKLSRDKNGRHLASQSVKPLPSKRKINTHIAPKSSLSKNQYRSKALKGSEKENEPEPEHTLNHLGGEKIYQLVGSTLNTNYQRKTSMDEQTRQLTVKSGEIRHVLPKGSPRNAQEKYDSKMEDKPKNIVDEDARIKVDQMMNSTRNLQCLICQKKVTRAGALRIHVRAIHLNLRPYKCQLCGFASHTNGNLSKHVKAVHLKLKPHRCKDCSYACSQMSDLKGHINRSHLKLKPYKCIHCSQAYPEKSDLNKHLKARHIEKAMSGCVKDLESNQSNDQEKRKALSGSKINTNSETGHNDERQKVEEMLNGTSRNSHCLICLKKFAHLKIHVEGFHLQLRPYKCKLCSYAFHQKGNLKRHLQQMHSYHKERQLQNQRSRDECGRSQKQLATETLKKKKAATKAVTCSVCSVVFSHRFVMLRHKRMCHALTAQTQLIENQSLQGSTETLGAMHISENVPEPKHAKERCSRKEKSVIRSDSEQELPYINMLEKETSELPYVKKGYGTEQRTCLFTKIPLRSQSETHHPQAPDNTAKIEDAEDRPQVDAITPKYTREDKTCDVCHKVFKYRIEMIRHKQRRHPSKSECVLNNTLSTQRSQHMTNEEESSESSVKEKPHIKTSMGKDSEFQQVKNRFSKDERTCAFCDKLFPCQEEKLQHQTKHIEGYISAMAKKEAEIENDALCIQAATPLEFPTKMGPEERGMVEDMLKPDNTGTSCTLCQQDFKRRPFLICHVNIVHLKLKPHKCKYCGHAFALGNNLKAHLKTVHRDIEVEAESAQDNVLSARKLPLKNIECDVCKKLFITNFSLLRHKKRHTSENVVCERVLLNVDDGNDPSSDTETSPPCEEIAHPSECAETIMQRQRNLTSYIPDVNDSDCLISTHSPGPSQIIAPSRTFKSPLSPMHTYGHSATPTHTKVSRVDKKVNLCTKCDHVFPNSEDLKQHLSQHSRGTKSIYSQGKVCDSIEKIECDVCKKLFISNFSWRRHRKMHTSDNSLIEGTPANDTTGDKDTSFGCDEKENHIAVEFSHQSESAESRNKAYRCTKCNNTFTNAELWREHLKWHLGSGTNAVHFEEKDSDLAMCEDESKPTENSFSYTCPACKMDVVGSFNLVMHIKQHMM